MEQCRTNYFEKLASSVINTLFACVLSLPIFMYFGFSLSWKISVFFIFFIYEIACYARKDKRDFGMIVMNSYWRDVPRFWQYALYTFLYSLSFLSLFVWVFFPFDIFLANIFFLQLPFVFFTGTTFHGFLEKMETVTHRA